MERKTPNSPKIYAKHKIGPTKNCFAWFWATFVFCAFLYEKVLFVMKRVLDVMKICLKSWKSQKCYCFGKLNLTNRFEKENSQFTKNIRETQNLSCQKLFCMILSNFWFLCFLVWKSAFCYETGIGAWCHENLLEVMKVSKMLLFW